MMLSSIQFSWIIKQIFKVEPEPEPGQSDGSICHKLHTRMSTPHYCKSTPYIVNAPLCQLLNIATLIYQYINININIFFGTYIKDADKKLKTNPKVLPRDVLSVGRFVPWDTFVPWDVLSVRHFVLGRFVCVSYYSGWRYIFRRFWKSIFMSGLWILGEKRCTDSIVSCLLCGQHPPPPFTLNCCQSPPP